MVQFSYAICIICGICELDGGAIFVYKSGGTLMFDVIYWRCYAVLFSVLIEYAYGMKSRT
jgi:hypothetical protein